MKRTELKRKTRLVAKTALRQKALQNITTAITKPRKALRQSRSTNTPTTAESMRIAAVKQIGCLACMLNREMGMPTAGFGACEAHHLLSGGRRRGQQEARDRPESLHGEATSLRSRVSGARCPSPSPTPARGGRAGGSRDLRGAARKVDPPR